MKLRLILMLIICFCFHKSFSQKMFYVYRNDGIINSFCVQNVDSIAFTEQNDSVYHNVYAKDSTYIIPVEIIDSVGFKTPKTIYKDDVYICDDSFCNLIVSQGTNYIRLLYKDGVSYPLIGRKIVSHENIDNQINPFMGRITNIEFKDTFVDISFSPISIEEVFDSYYGVSSTLFNEVASDKSIKKISLLDKKYSINLNKINKNFVTKDDNMAFSAGYDQSADITFTPHLDYVCSLIVNKDYGVNLSITAIGLYNIEENISVSGKMDIKANKSLWKKTIPIRNCLIDLNIDFGCFFEATCNVSSNLLSSQGFKHIFHWEWNSKNKENIQNINSFIPLSFSNERYCEIKGSFSVGCYNSIGISFLNTTSWDIDKMSFKIKGGLNCEGNGYLSKHDTNTNNPRTSLYNKLKDQYVSMSWFYGSNLDVKLFSWSKNFSIPIIFNIPFNKKYEIKKIMAVPKFKNTLAEASFMGGIDCYTYPYENTFSEDLGFAATVNDSVISKKYVFLNYKEELKRDLYTHINSDSCIVYPLVKYMNLDILGTPSFTFYPKDFIVSKVKSIMDNNAVLCANGKCENFSCDSIQCGFFYGTNKTLDQEISVKVPKSGSNTYLYSLSIDGLKPQTLYYYKSYIRCGDKYLCDKIKSFYTFPYNGTVSFRLQTSSLSRTTCGVDTIIKVKFVNGKASANFNIYDDSYKETMSPLVEGIDIDISTNCLSHLERFGIYEDATIQVMWSKNYPYNSYYYVYPIYDIQPNTNKYVTPLGKIYWRYNDFAFDTGLYGCNDFIRLTIVE